jgi:hypothetical protein
MMERLDKHADKKRAAQAEKRFKGRLRKWLGDLCLLCGTALDAVKHYLAAANECRSSGDALWQAAAIEGLCAALCGAVLGPAAAASASPAASPSSGGGFDGGYGCGGYGGVGGGGSASRRSFWEPAGTFRQQQQQYGGEGGQDPAAGSMVCGGGVTAAAVVDPAVMAELAKAVPDFRECLAGGGGGHGGGLGGLIAGVGDLQRSSHAGGGGGGGGGSGSGSGSGHGGGSGGGNGHGAADRSRAGHPHSQAVFVLTRVVNDRARDALKVLRSASLQSDTERAVAAQM